MAFFITLWIENGAVLKSSSQWQLMNFEKRKKKKKDSWTELFHFQIFLIAIDKNF